MNWLSIRENQNNYNVSKVQNQQDIVPLVKEQEQQI